MGSNRHLTVEYEALVAQLAAVAELLERLRAGPETPKSRAAVERLEEAQRLMLAAFGRCESESPFS